MTPHCIRLVLVATLLMPLAAAHPSAQAAVVGSRDPESLFTSPDPKLNANKQVVLHIMRDLLEANHWDNARSTSRRSTSSTTRTSRRVSTR